jgi:hypothetical protein
MSLVSIHTCISLAFLEVSKPITVHPSSDPLDPAHIKYSAPLAMRRQAASISS